MSALSGDWIKTEYNNQNRPQTFHYIRYQEQWSVDRWKIPSPFISSAHVHE